MTAERASPAIAIAVGAGICGAIQPKLNAELGERVGSAMVASLVNFLVALLIVGGALLLRPRTRRTLAGVRRWNVPAWNMTAGLGGVFIVVAGAVTVDKIGVAIFSVAFFAGQIVAGLLVDRIGVAPGGKRPITAARMQAVGLAVVAVAVAQIGRDAGDFAPAYVAFVVAAGAAIAFQSAFNATIASAVGDPVAATALNVIVGTVALVAILGGIALSGNLDPLDWPGEPWLYTGGALGVTVVLSMAVATAAVGVLGATLAMLASQLIAAFLVDWLVLEEAPTVGIVAGGLLIVAAVARVGRRSRYSSSPTGLPSTIWSRYSDRP